MSRMLLIDREGFERDFGRASTAVRHRLADHPLLSTTAIAELAEALAERDVEHNLGKLAVVASENAPRAELSPGEVARGIATNGCWMVLKNIERDPDYARLLDSSLDEVAELVGVAEGGMGRREGFIFLSAPGSVTPAHIDPEHNLLLQVRGRKDINIGTFPGPDLEQRELERFHCGGHRNLLWAPESPTTYSLGPGDGVYVPVHAPHWVTVAGDVAVSLSITFRTPACDDQAVLSRLNGRLRRMHLSPAPIGRRPRRDRTKLAVGRGVQAVRQRTRQQR